MTWDNQKAGLYIHVPFCTKKCNYCDFYSLSGADSLKEDYAYALIEHLKARSKTVNESFDSVYIGGGTPTSLGTDLLCKVIETVTNSFLLDNDTEFTVETNPGLLDKTDFKTLFSIGVNRLSVGLQSANKSELEMLGRIHTTEDFEKTFTLAREAGFANISTDIMFSLPNSTTDTLTSTLDYITKISPEHISAYSLKIECGTPFYKMRDSLKLPSEDEDADMYLLIHDRLASCGYTAYEISNFAKPGFESRHNLKYWQHVDYLGFGPGAHSFFRGERFAYSRDINAYIKTFTSGENDAAILSEHYRVDENEAVRERLMLSLRLASGADDELLGCFAPIDEIYKKLAPLISAGLVTKTESGIALTKSGMYVSNSIINLIYG